MRVTNNKWEVYSKYYDPKKIDHVEVKRMFDLIEEHSVVLPDNVMEDMKNYLLEYSRNDKIDLLLIQ